MQTIYVDGRPVELDPAHTYAISILVKGQYVDAFIEQTVRRNVRPQYVSNIVNDYESSGYKVCRVWRELF